MEKGNCKRNRKQTKCENNIINLVKKILTKFVFLKFKILYGIGLKIVTFLRHSKFLCFVKLLLFCCIIISLAQTETENHISFGLLYKFYIGLPLV